MPPEINITPLAPGFRTAAIIVAAGQGLRFGRGSGDPPKQLLPLKNSPLISRTVSAFLSAPRIDEVIVVAPPDILDCFARLAGLSGEVKIVSGGASRSASTRQGLEAVSEGIDLILVHDGVRPLITGEDIDRVRLDAARFGAAILAVPVSDTLKLGDADGFISRTVDRRGLWRAQTPQGFQRAVIERSLAQADLTSATDESSLAEAIGCKVKLTLGSPANLKITQPQDLVMAEKLAADCPLPNPARRIRVGQGFDFHRFDPERPLFLGCLFVPGHPGLLGHSDADVLAHAFIDALFGAAGLRDIGQMFPSSEERWRGASGSELLARTKSLLDLSGWALVNADLTLIGERPSIAEHREAMAASMASALGVSADLINLKGKTSEGMGFTGRGEGLAAAAAVLLTSAGD